MSKKIIRQLISRDHLGKVIELMIELAPKYASSDTENTLYNLSGQYYNNEKARRERTIRDDSYNVTRARVTSSITDILGDSFKEIDNNDIPEEYTSLLNTALPIEDAGGEGNGDQPAVKKSDVVLFLSANPSQTALLKLKDEHSNIAIELQHSAIQVKSERAISFSEFSKAIYDTKPRIVHFSGHGDLKAPEVVEAYRTRGIGKPEDNKKKGIQEEEPGIILFDETKRNPFFVKASVLRRTFKTMVQRQNIPIEAVIFNACHSEQQAKAVSEVGVSVIGTSHEIKDAAALAFSTGFYSALARGENIVDSLDWAINQVMAYGEPEDRFTLYKDGKKIDI